MECRALTKDDIQLTRLHHGDPGGIKMPKAALELCWAAECLLDRHLLVQGEPDKQGERLVDKQPVRSIIAGERKGGRDRHGRMVPPMT